MFYAIRWAGKVEFYQVLHKENGIATVARVASWCDNKGMHTPLRDDFTTIPLYRKIHTDEAGEFIITLPDSPAFRADVWNGNPVIPTNWNSQMVAIGRIA